ncbi:MAG: 16S rRNA (uracil(1498)-N(3))-methyltransferase [Ruminococcus sp.]
MYRFFVDKNQIENNLVYIRGNDVNHIRNVLRMKPGEEMCVSTGDRLEYRCAVLEYRENEVVAELRYVQETDLELPSKIYLFQGLPKADKMDLIIQKAVELGAWEIIPVAMKRCVVKLDDKKEAARLKRWNAISESAAKQAKRMIVPEVAPILSFAEALQKGKECDVLLMPYEMARDMRETRRILNSICPGQSVGVFIGPEGGFAPEEVRMAEETGASFLTLGKRILRTETAGMTMLSILMFQLEREE